MKQKYKTFYKCGVCGSVSNWKEVITKGLCHKEGYGIKHKQLQALQTLHRRK